MEESILLEVFSHINFTEEERTTIGSYFEQVQLKKGAHLLQYGETVLHTHYVYNGCLRTYFIDPSGKDHTLQFAIKDWWISDYTAFFSASRATMHIECIQNTTLFRLARKDMERLYMDIPKFETYFRKKLENRMVAFHKRTIGNLSLSAKEQYLSFIKTYPSIEQIVKNYHIASYLGMTTQTLSRIRKELVQ
ncbi:MAG: Crp/Fnr family transcriptional regulator [Bacteroidota bacterium]